MRFSELRVSRAVPSDLSRLCELERCCFGEARAWDEPIFREELESGEVWLVDLDGQAAGYVAFVEHDTWLELDSIAVLPEQRRRGLARLILALLVARAPSGRIQLEVEVNNESAIRLYRGAGFVEIDRIERFYSDGSDAIVMARAPDGDPGRDHHAARG